MRFERFDTPGPLALQVALGAADVHVTTWEHPATEVEIEGRRDDEATAAVVDAFTVVLHPRSDGHELVIREAKGRGFGFRLRDAQLSVRVRCPEGVSLGVAGGSSDIRGDGALGAVDLKTGSGDVVFNGTLASARVTSASGDVRLEAIDGQATVVTASGDVSLGRVEGPLSANTVSGDVEVGDAHAGAVLQSVSGDVQVASVRGGDVRVQTVSGDAQVALAPGLAVWIDAGSVSGDVSSDLEVGAAPAGEPGAVAEVRVKSVSGDVTITRARVAAPSP